jgi:hypothetical protein
VIHTLNRHLSTTEKWVVSVFLVLKLALLLMLPLTGDEAYFIGWAQIPALGYYDHPPAVGWVIYLLGLINDHYYFYRLFAYVSTFFVSWLLYRLVRSTHDDLTATLVALIFLTSPLSLFAVMLVNDIVLLLFGLIGFYCVVKALDRTSIAYAVVAGVFLGLTFLSKYLSVPLFVGIFLYLLFNRVKQSWMLALVAMGVTSLFVAENLYFNLHSCWNNVLFNLFSRTKGSGFNPDYVALYVAILVFAVPPQGIYRLLKSKFSNPAPSLKLAIYISSSFLLVFLLASSFIQIGLHWIYLPVSFIYLLFSLLQVKHLHGLLKYNAIFSILIATVLLFMISQIDLLFSDNKDYRDTLVYTQAEKICEALPQGETIYTLNYSDNAVLSYHCKNNRFHVFASTSKYGREDDKRINYQDKDGNSLYLLLLDLDDRNDIERYFDSIQVVRTPMTEKIDYHLVKGENFDFESYRLVIEEVKNRFYSPPSWLTPASCEFTDKYNL